MVAAASDDKPPEFGNDDQRRQWMIRGVKGERKRWLEAFKNAGISIGTFSSVEKAAHILRWKMEIAKEYAWEEMKALAKQHAEACGNPCAEQILDELKKKQGKSPPTFGKEQDPPPFELT